ncbi:hypothetical protein ACIO3O_09030 [Streptomyces sp. NPDC087440]|uniref:hypothetical protein n=1 Tax=Streptomyces sp. NPDC087440 TaxID=3365790 RepID=UPI00382F087D
MSVTGSPATVHRSTASRAKGGTGACAPHPDGTGACGYAVRHHGEPVALAAADHPGTPRRTARRIPVRPERPTGT